MVLKTKYDIGDVVFILHNNKINMGTIDGVTKTTLSKNLKKTNHTQEQETYHIKIKNGVLCTTNNVNHLYESIEELLINIELVEL